MSEEKKIFELKEEYLDKVNGGVSEEVLSMIQERINGLELNSNSGLSSVNFEPGKWVRAANDFSETNIMAFKLLELNGDILKVDIWYRIINDFSGKISIFPVRNVSFPSTFLGSFREIEKPEWVTE